VGKGIERLLTACQEGLLSIEQLRTRVSLLRQREQSLRAELQAIADQSNDQIAFLRLAENLTAFLTRLRSVAETLSFTERQRIVRLVKEVLVGDDTITIRHSIPIPPGNPQNHGTQSRADPDYLPIASKREQIVVSFAVVSRMYKCAPQRNAGVSSSGTEAAITLLFHRGFRW
jgi:hypothetical protein